MVLMRAAAMPITDAHNNGKVIKAPNTARIEQVKSRPVCQFSYDQAKPLNLRTIGYSNRTWNRYDPKKAIPAPLSPKYFTQGQANPKLTRPHASSQKIRSPALPLATMMNPI